MNKAPLIAGKFRTKPGGSWKKGTKRHILANQRGGPLSIVIVEANRHDVSQLYAVLKQKSLR